jgi:FKBP-type peptidyl-prolyl cis-trans isomerase FkpA
MIIRMLLFSLFISGLVSCNQGGTASVQQNLPVGNKMEEMNRYLVQKDRERIESYISRRNLNMTESGTGFWYEIKSEGEGNYLEDNDHIVLEYECSLLDGTKCYSSGEMGPKELVLGKSPMEAGMNQGLRLLKHGGEAVFIIPPYLAYGIVGDGNKIPSRAVIVYNVRVQTEK